MIEKKEVKAPVIVPGPSPASGQVSWFETYCYSVRLANGHDVQLSSLPLPGTALWCGMGDDDDRKLLALVLGGVRDALRNDTYQSQMAEASKAVAASADWSAVARWNRDRAAARASGVYIERRRTA